MATADGYTFVLDLDYSSFETKRVRSCRLTLQLADGRMGHGSNRPRSPKSISLGRPLREHLRHRAPGRGGLDGRGLHPPCHSQRRTAFSDRSWDWLSYSAGYREFPGHSTGGPLEAERPMPSSPRVAGRLGLLIQPAISAFHSTGTPAVGARYLRLPTYQLFPISDEEIVDFTGYPLMRRPETRRYRCWGDLDE